MSAPACRACGATMSLCSAEAMDGLCSRNGCFLQWLFWVGERYPGTYIAGEVAAALVDQWLELGKPKMVVAS